MAAAYLFKCTKCSLSLEAWDEGNPYITDHKGTRHYFYHPAGEDIVEEVLRLDPGAPATKEEREAYLASRMGNEWDWLCLECGSLSQIDKDTHNLACSSCSSTKLKEVMEIEGVMCPKCYKGTLRMEQASTRFLRRIFRLLKTFKRLICKRSNAFWISQGKFMNGI